MSTPDQIRAREARAEAIREAKRSERERRVAEAREAERAARENDSGGVVVRVQRPKVTKGGAA